MRPRWLAFLLAFLPFTGMAEARPRTLIVPRPASPVLVALWDPLAPRLHASLFEIKIPDGGGSGGGGGTCPNASAGQVLFQSGTDCAGDADLTFSGDTLSATKGIFATSATISADGVFVVGTNGGNISQQTAGTPDQSGLWTGSAGNAWIIAEVADKEFDFAHAARPSPTLFIHSAAQSTTQWLGLAHDGTNAIFIRGTGVFSFDNTQKTSGNIQISSPGNHFTLGTSAEAGAYMYNSAQTPDSALLATGSLSNAIVVAEFGDSGFDFAHAAAINPTLFIHSAAQSTTQWLGLTHNGTDAYLTIGTGSFRIGANVLFDSYTQLTSDNGLWFGTPGNTSSVILFDSGDTPDTLGLFTGSTSRGIVIAETADRGFNFAHAQQTNPTLFIHSAAQSTTEFVGVANNGKGTVISTQGTTALTEAGGAETFATVTTATTQTTGGEVRYTVQAADSAGGPDYVVRSGTFTFAMTNSAGTTVCGTGGLVTETSTALAQGGVPKTLTFTIAATNGANTCVLSINIDSDIVTVTSASIVYTMVLNGPGTVS